jgi:hypothetical protein
MYKKDALALPGNLQSRKIPVSLFIKDIASPLLPLSPSYPLSSSFKIVIQKLSTDYGTFCSYAIICSVSIWCCHTAPPETKQYPFCSLASGVRVDKADNEVVKERLK